VAPISSSPEPTSVARNRRRERVNAGCHSRLGGPGVGRLAAVQVNGVSVPQKGQLSADQASRHTGAIITVRPLHDAAMVDTNAGLLPGRTMPKT
jgi:hypothetical protein